MTRSWAAALALVAMIGSVAAQEPSLDTVLARAGAYVTDYKKRLAGIVAEEHYRQNVVSTSRPGRSGNRQYRELRADLLLVKPGEGDSWLQFRDVFEVDGKPVRDRDQRLYQLFLTAKADRRAQAEAIQQESSRYNIGPLQRTINIPIMALMFLDPEVQPGVSYERGEAGNVSRFAPMAAAADIWMIAFRETASGTLVRGERDRDIPSHGRIWLDSTSGRIVRTEQISEDTAVRAVIDVTYKTEAGMDLLVPSEMRESYLIRRTEVRIDGRATYRRFRQFTVTTTEKPKPQ